MTESEGLYARLVQKWPLLPGRAQNALAAIQSAISHHISETAGREMEAGGIRPMALDLLLNTWVGLLHCYVANGRLWAPEGSVLKRYEPALLDDLLMLVKN